MMAALKVWKICAEWRYSLLAFSNRRSSQPYDNPHDNLDTTGLK